MITTVFNGVGIAIIILGGITLMCVGGLVFIFKYVLPILAAIAVAKALVNYIVTGEIFA